MLATSSAPEPILGLAAVARVLLVESHLGSLAAVARALDAHGLAHAAVQGHRAAADKLQFEPRFTLCLSDLTEDDEGRRDLHYRFPELAWIVRALPGSAPPVRPQDQRICGHDEDLLEAALAALRNHPYDQPALDAMEQALCSMWSPFGARRSLHFLRRDARNLDGIAAVVEVAGRELWGRVVFSASEKVLFRQARRILGSEPRSVDDVADTAGECANRLASDVRHHYRQFGLISTQSAPLVIIGSGTRIAPICQTPALVVEHRSERGDRVHFEWHLGVKPDTDGRVAYGRLPTGEAVFL